MTLLSSLPHKATQIQEQTYTQPPSLCHLTFFPSSHPQHANKVLLKLLSLLCAAPVQYFQCYAAAGTVVE